MNEQIQYLTERQVARITGFSLSVLRNHRHKKMGMPWLRVFSRSVRYRLGDVLEYMEQNKMQTGD